MKSFNVLFITTDQQRFDALGANGNPHIRTPNLDRLAARSVNLQRHYTSNPVCTPARSSILTGQYPHTHGAQNVGVTLPRETQGLAHWLGAAGYRCGLFGKAHFEPEQSEYILRIASGGSYRGFHETWITEDNVIGPYLDWIRRDHPEHLNGALELQNEGLPIVSAPNRYGVTNGRLDACYTASIPETYHPSTWIADRTLEFIERSHGDGHPFFAWCSFVDPHHPWTPCEPYASLYDPGALPPPNRRPAENEGIGDFYFHTDGLADTEYQRLCAAYYAMVTQIDTQVGRILDALEQWGIQEKTLIVFTSDHGEYNGDHGLIRKGQPWYDSLLRVPMLVSLPGIRAGKNTRTSTQHEDIAPTILDILGLPCPESVEGRSFLPALHDGETETRRYVYFECDWQENQGLSGIQRDSWKLLLFPKLEDLRSPAKGKALMIFDLPPDPHDAQGRSALFFNLADDPGEYKNLIGNPRFSAVETELRRALLEWTSKGPRRCLPRTHGY